MALTNSQEERDFLGISVIYKLVNPVTNKAVYVGKTYDWPLPQPIKIRGTLNTQLQEYIARLKHDHDAELVPVKLEDAYPSEAAEKIRKWAVELDQISPLINHIPSSTRDWFNRQRIKQMKYNVIAPPLKK